MSIIPSLAQRLGWIVEPLRAVLAAHAGRHRAAAPMVLLLHGYLNRLVRRFAALTERPAKPRIAAPAADRPPSATPRKPRPPTGFAALSRMTLEVNAYGSQLRYLICSPEMKQLLAISPRAASILRPLCRMLGVGPPDADLPPALFPPRRTAAFVVPHSDRPSQRPPKPTIICREPLVPA